MTNCIFILWICLLRNVISCQIRCFRNISNALFAKYVGQFFSSTGPCENYRTSYISYNFITNTLHFHHTFYEINIILSILCYPDMEACGVCQCWSFLDGQSPELFLMLSSAGRQERIISVAVPGMGTIKNTIIRRVIRLACS